MSGKKEEGSNPSANLAFLPFKISILSLFHSTPLEVLDFGLEVLGT